jgi:DNA-binding transcriptional LysR family regulator
VASPAYLERHGTPRAPQDLLAHNCIIGRFGPDWPFLDEHGRPMTLRVRGNLSTDSGDVLREAAVTGLGVSQATWWLFRQELESGTVVPILEEFAVEADPISIIYPGQRHVPACVRAVIDFFVELTRAAAPDTCREGAGRQDGGDRMGLAGPRGGLPNSDTSGGVMRHSAGMRHENFSGDGR